ncbi:MAG: hypothetical protein FJZ63_02890, partial [Chlamydiae bacterium]|nr:hypothetical protein [Chlamydiota bacterium]
MIKFDDFLVKVRKKNKIHNLHTLLLIKSYKFWDKILSYLFKYSSRCYQRKTPVHIDKLKNTSLPLKYFSDYFGRFSTSKTLIGNVTYSLDDISVAKYLLKLTFTEIKNPKLCELATTEILSKVLAYRSLQENMRFFIPILSPGYTSELVEYSVDTLFDLWHGHVAFGLYPLDHPTASSILLFRG